MTIIFKLLSDGAFVAGDTASGKTAYAYPTSTNAEAAKKATPARRQKLAASMVGYEIATGDRAEYDARHWRQLVDQDLAAALRDLREAAKGTLEMIAADFARAANA